MKDSEETKMILQLYSNIKRLEIIDSHIDQLNSGDANIKEIISEILLYHKTLERIIHVFEKSFFSCDEEN